MSPRQSVAAVLLWSVLVFVGTMFGASVYQRISLIPEWGGDLPQSVVAYFGDPRAGQAIDRFWTLVTAPTVVLVDAWFIPLLRQGRHSSIGRGVGKLG